MKESKAVYVTKKHIRENLLHRDYQLCTNNSIELNKYRLTNDVGIQYNSKRDNVYIAHRNLTNTRRYYDHDLRYFNPIPKLYSYTRSRSFTDIGVGSVKALQKKKVKKIYLPETDDRGVGSSDLTSFLARMQSLQNKSKTAKQNRPAQSYYDTKRTSSKCVGGTVEYRAECLVSAKVSPIVHTKSASTCARDQSPIDLRETKETDNKSIENGSLVIEKQFVTTHTQFEEPELEISYENVVETPEPKKQEHISKTPQESKEAIVAAVQIKPIVKELLINKSVKEEAKPAISKPSEPKKSEEDITVVFPKKISEMPEHLKGSFSSDSLVQHVHNLEQPSEYCKQRDPMENKMEREYRKIFSSMSKEQKPDTPVEKQMPRKSTSLFRRRFTAIRKSLGKKDSKNTMRPNEASVPSVRDASITSDPPSLEERSFSSIQGYPTGKRPTAQRKASYKKSYTGKKTSKTWSKANVVDSECGQGVMGMFKLWGRKFNLEDPPHNVKEDEIYLNSSENKPREKGELFVERVPKHDSVTLPEVAEDNILEIDKEKKEGKKFLFFKKRHSKDKTKNQNQTFKTKKGVTTGRCEVRDGLSLRMGARPQTPVKKKPPPVPELLTKPLSTTIDDELHSAAWLIKYLNNPIESRNSVKIRWNNKTYTTSSSTIFELIGSVYKNSGVVVKSKSDITTDISSTWSYNRPNVNYMQQIEAWMIPNTIPDKTPPVILINRSEDITLSNNCIFERKMQDKNIEATISEHEWIIDKPNACARNIEVVLHSKNFLKLHKPEKSAQYIRIDIPKGFFNDSSSDDPQPEHTSLEQICNIVEYESANFGSQMKKANTLSRMSNSGDHSTESESIQVTFSMKSELFEEPKALETVMKRPPVHRDVVIQGSDVYIPKLCDVIGVGIITQREVREPKQSIVRVVDYLSDEESDHSLRNCFLNNNEFARSYLLESYRHWQAPGQEMFSWCVSDSHMQCCTANNSWENYNRGDACKSCPNIFGEYVIMVSSYSSGPCQKADPPCCQEEKNKKKEKKPKEKKQKDKHDKIEDIPRVLPKDSVEVFKKRKIYAQEKSKWLEDSTMEPYSDPCNADTGVQGKLDECVKCTQKAKLKKTAKISSDTACTIIDKPCCTRSDCTSNAEICCVKRKEIEPACCKEYTGDNCCSTPCAPPPPGALSHKSPRRIQSPKVCQSKPCPAMTPTCQTTPICKPSPACQPTPTCQPPTTQSPPTALKCPQKCSHSPQKRTPLNNFPTSPPKLQQRPPVPQSPPKIPYVIKEPRSCDKCPKKPCYLSSPPVMNAGPADCSHYPDSPTYSMNTPPSPHRSCQTKTGSFRSISTCNSASCLNETCKSMSPPQKNPPIKESVGLLKEFSCGTETQTLSECPPSSHGSLTMFMECPRGHRCVTGIKISNADCVGFPEPQTYGPLPCPNCPGKGCLPDCPNKKMSCPPKSGRSCPNYPPKPSNICPPQTHHHPQKSSPCPHELTQCPKVSKKSCPHKIPYCPSANAPKFQPIIPPCPHKTSQCSHKTLQCPYQTSPSPPKTLPDQPKSPPSPPKTQQPPPKSPPSPPSPPNQKCPTKKSPSPPKQPCPTKTSPCPTKAPPSPLKCPSPQFGQKFESETTPPPPCPPSPPKQPCPNKTSPSPPKSSCPPSPPKQPCPTKTSPCPTKAPPSPPKCPSPKEMKIGPKFGTEITPPPPAADRCPRGFKISNTNCERFGGSPAYTESTTIRDCKPGHQTKNPSCSECSDQNISCQPVEEDKTKKTDCCKKRSCTFNLSPDNITCRDCQAETKKSTSSSAIKLLAKKCSVTAKLRAKKSPNSPKLQANSPCYQISTPPSFDSNIPLDDPICKCPTPTDFVIDNGFTLIEDQANSNSEDRQNQILKCESAPQNRPYTDCNQTDKQLKSQPNLVKGIIGVFLKKYPRKITKAESDIIIKSNCKENITFDLKEDDHLSRQEGTGVCLKIQDDDNITLVERKDYKKSNQAFITNIYNDKKSNRMSAPITINKISSVERENKLSKNKSTDSIINMIEINFKLRVIQGDKTTEINIANEDSQIIGDENKKLNNNQADHSDVRPKEVYILKDENTTDEINPKNDLNIRILIKNYKTKTADPTKEKKAVDDFSQKISKKFNTVSTGYSVDFKGEHADDTCFSIHRATIDLTTSELTASKDNLFVEKRKSELYFERLISNEILSHVVEDKTEAENICSIPNTISKRSFTSDVVALNSTTLNTLSEHTKSERSRCMKRKSKHSIESETLSDKCIENISNKLLSRSSRSIKSKRKKSSKGYIEFNKTFDTSESTYIKRSAKVVEVTDLFKSEARLSFTDTDDRDISLENKTSEEPTDLTAKTSDERVYTVGKSSEDRTDRTDLDSDTKTSGFIIEKVPTEEMDPIDLGKSEKEQKKEMLKQVFDYANFKKPKTKNRIQRLKDILRALLTSDDTESDIDNENDSKEQPGYAWDPNTKYNSDSLNNYFEGASIIVSKTALHTNTTDSILSHASGFCEDKEKPKTKTCICSNFAEKLNLGGGGCCCRKTPVQVCEQVSCNLVNELTLKDYSFFAPSVACVHCQTNNSRYKSSIHCSKIVSISSKKTSFITPQSQKTSITTSRSQKSFITQSQGEPDSLAMEPLSAKISSKSTKSYSVEKSSGEGLYLPEADEFSEIVPIGTKVSVKISKREKNFRENYQELDCVETGISKENSGTQSPSKRETKKKHLPKIKHQADVLQMYETKKAVLEIYAEKTVTDDEEHMVATLPKFQHGTESQLYDSYEQLERNSYKKVYKRKYVMMCIGR